MQQVVLCIKYTMYLFALVVVLILVGNICNSLASAFVYVLLSHRVAMPWLCLSNIRFVEPNMGNAVQLKHIHVGHTIYCRPFYRQIDSQTILAIYSAYLNYEIH